MSIIRDFAKFIEPTGQLEYDNTNSGLSADTIKSAIDEINVLVGGGNVGSQATFSVYEFVATGGQTVFNLASTFTTGDNVTAGNFVIGTKYTITATNTTDFTTIGAADSNPGTVFEATGAGTGTGTAKLSVTYVPGYIQVYLNGIFLAAEDYNATDGQILTLTEAAELSDLLSIVVLDSLNMALLLKVTNIDSNAPENLLSVDSSGNVGLGTATPVNTLHVDDAAGGTVRVTRLGTSPTAYGIFEHDGTNTSITSSAELIFNTNATPAMRIDASGNVGIGETSPSTYGNLVVAGSTPFTVMRSTDVTTAGFSMLVNSGSNGVGSISTDDGGHMTFDTGSTGAGQAERMRIDAVGNVGIGVSPEAWNTNSTALDIGSLTTLWGDTSQSILSHNVYKNISGLLAYRTTAAASYYEQNAGNHIWYNAVSGTNDADITTMTERARIDTSGNFVLPDNGKAIFGAGSDLQIYHDGSNSYLEDTGTGVLFIKGTGGVYLRGKTTDEDLGRFLENGAVDLYYDGSSKLATTSTGINVTGTVTTGTVVVGDTSSSFSAIYITSSATGESELRLGDTDTDAGSISYTNSDDTMTFRAAAGPRMSLDSSGLDVTGSVTADGLTVETSADPALITLRHTGNTSGLIIKNFSGGESQLVNVDSGPMVFKTNDTEAMRIDSSGSILKVSGSNVTLPAISTSLIEGEIRGSEGAITTIDSGLLRLSAGGGTTVGVKAGIDIFRGATDGSLIRMFTNGTEAMRIDSSGNVGIGAESPTTIATDTSSISLGGTSSTVSGGIAYQINDVVKGYHYVESNFLIHQTVSGIGQRFWADGSEAMRLTANGNLLVGKTSTSSAIAGTTLWAGGYINSTVSSDYVARFNRLTSDGEIFQFQKDSAPVGSIGVKQSDAAIGDGELYVASGNTGLFFDDQATPSNYIRPCNASGALRDNIVDLGKSDSRFKDLYLSGAVIIDADGATGNAWTHFKNDDRTWLVGCRGTDGDSFTIYDLTADVPRVKVDASGNLLVGKTVVDGGVNGGEIRSNGETYLTATSAQPLALNRKSTDGAIATFAKDGAPVGSIGVHTSGVVGVSLRGNASYGGIGLPNDRNTIWPINSSSAPTDNVMDIGSSSVRFKDLYLSGAVVHTFDIVNNGTTDYQFSDTGNNWFPTAENDPVLYLRRGEAYIFSVVAGGHPFEIRVSNGGAAYNTGVTNNGAQNGDVIFRVPMSAPATLYYQCTVHSGMGNIINII